MKNILFVDDEPALLKALQRLLRPKHTEWNMTFANSGAEALDKLAAGPFDVIVSDMRMPNMDGATLLTKVTELYPETARIILSGHAETEAGLRALPITHQFLHKPCDPDQLRAAIDRAANLRAFFEDEALAKTVKQIDRLPSLPTTYSALTRALAADASLKEIAKIIERDVAMCAKVLHIANSAFFGANRKVVELANAVSLVGVNAIKSLVFSVEVFRSFKMAAPIEGFSMDALQEHALLTANIAKKLVADRRQADDAFMAGILHDVGTLILATRFPKKLATVYATVKKLGRADYLVEHDEVGADHAQIGAYLLSLWGLPYTIIEAVAFHHQPVRGEAGAPTTLDILAAVHIANALARTAKMPGPAPEDPSTLPERLDPVVIDALGVRGRIVEWRLMAKEQVELLTSLG